MISFYGAQLLELRTKIQSLQSRGELERLNVRTNTVDRFQGMERPIIVLSLVRSKKGHVGDFVKRFQRINVAMSRAQELLVVVGCAETFQKLQVDVKGRTGALVSQPVYRNILAQIHRRSGIISAREYGF